MCTCLPYNRYASKAESGNIQEFVQQIKSHYRARWKRREKILHNLFIEGIDISKRGKVSRDEFLAYASDVYPETGNARPEDMDIEGQNTSVDAHVADRERIIREGLTSLNTSSSGTPGLFHGAATFFTASGFEKMTDGEMWLTWTSFRDSLLGAWVPKLPRLDVLLR